MKNAILQGSIGVALNQMVPDTAQTIVQTVSSQHVDVQTPISVIIGFIYATKALVELIKSIREKRQNRQK